jgi:hypothetical protein
VIASTLLPPFGEVPEGRARGVQDTATQVQSESEARGPVRETGVTPPDLHPGLDRLLDELSLQHWIRKESNNMG